MINEHTDPYDELWLSRTIKRFIKEKEKELNRKCRKIWRFTNPNGQTYLFGSFCKNYDRLFVTIGYYNGVVNGHYIPAR